MLSRGVATLQCGQAGRRNITKTTEFWCLSAPDLGRIAYNLRIRRYLVIHDISLLFVLFYLYFSLLIPIKRVARSLFIAVFSSYSFFFIVSRIRLIYLR
jgi:hypothetical protein